MDKKELRNIIREEAHNVIRERQTLKEGIFSRLLNMIWTITGTKDGLFKAIRSQYGPEVDRYKSELNDINKRLAKIHNEIEDVLNMPENKR